MIVVTSKWLIVLLLFLVVLAALYFWGKKSVHSEIIIPTPANQVWTVLMDTDNYEKWNEVLTLVEGKLESGSTVKYRFSENRDKVYEISSYVEQIVENKLINQRGGIPGILTFDHRYQLESIEGNKETRVIIHEEYRGIGVNFWNPKSVGVAYETLNQNLKNRTLEIFQHD